MTSKPLTEEYLEEVRRRYEAATPGPWISYIEGRDHTSGSDFIMRGENGAREEDLELNGGTEADQDFIAHAHQDIPLLLDEIYRLSVLLKDK